MPCPASTALRSPISPAGIEPGQRVLFVSGYADTAAIEQAVGDARVLRKPFRAANIAHAVQQALSD